MNQNLILLFVLVSLLFFVDNVYAAGINNVNNISDEQYEIIMTMEQYDAESSEYYGKSLLVVAVVLLSGIVVVLVYAKISNRFSKNIDSIKTQSQLSPQQSQLSPQQSQLSPQSNSTLQTSDVATMTSNNQNFTKKKSGTNDSKLAHLRTCFNDKHYDQAISVCHQIINNTIRDSVKATAMLYLAKSLERQEKFDLALSAYGNVLKLTGGCATIHMDIGVLLEKMGKLELSVYHYEQCLLKMPDNSLAADRKFHILHALVKHDK